MPRRQLLQAADSEQSHGAGELFDPHSVPEIADAIDRLWSSEEALSEAEAKISERRARMSWEPFRAVYCQAYDYAMSHPLGGQKAA